MRRVLKRKRNPFVRAVAHIGISLLLGVGFSAIAAKLVLSGILPVNWLQMTVCLIQLLSAIVGCMCTALCTEKRRLLYTAITGGGYFLLLGILSSAFFSGAFHGLLPAFAVCAAAILISAVTAAQIKKPRFRAAA